MKKLVETLKTMTFKEAVDYIWEYYKLHIIGTILGVAFLWSILATVLGEKEETYQMTVVGQVSYDTAEAFSEDLNERYFDDFRVLVDNMISGDGTLADMNYAEVQKFWANMGANMVDVIVAAEPLVEQLHEQEGLMPVEEYVDLSTLEEGAALFPEDSDQVYGISVSDIPMFEDYPEFHSLILVFPINSENHQHTPEVMEALLSNPSE
ncbi:hypothetical protein [Gracilibacillus alcaliphilus]|uniref:hypothetical protein n=1 Tax=Gracilibacillus alcaliphilus TaxID=1401441 RepID=UPI0019562B26|nr:hypothetical protein [Gracilibacillus alcaliphilus]MBM7679534.1 hypothetical protein [Gracilibacillus alcaliphilus]